MENSKMAPTPDVPPDLGQLKQTANKTGFDFGGPTFRIQEWIDSYDGIHPLADVGCGMGKCIFQVVG